MPLSKYRTFLNSAMLKKGQLQVQSEGAKQDSSSSGLGGAGPDNFGIFFFFLEMVETVRVLPLRPAEPKLRIETLP